MDIEKRNDITTGRICYNFRVIIEWRNIIADFQVLFIIECKLSYLIDKGKKSGLKHK